MYKRDCKKIAKWAMQKSENFNALCCFVQTTIQMPLSRTLGEMQDIREFGADSTALWGNKIKAYIYLTENIDTLFADIKQAVADDDIIRAMDIMTEVPNLGMVKAGFVLQMCGLDVSCLDTHNIRRLQEAGYDIKAGDLKLPAGLKRETKLKKLAKYVKLTRETGGAEYWWNTWCNYVAEKGGMNKSLPTGDIVSKFHVTAVMA